MTAAVARSVSTAVSPAHRTSFSADFDGAICQGAARTRRHAEGRAPASLWLPDTNHERSQSAPHLHGGV